MTRNETPYNRFAFYHQNEPLLYQFFLHEYLEASSLLKEKPSALLLDKLVGYSVHPWNPPSGTLRKLLHFSNLHCTHFDDKPAFQTIRSSLERAFAAGELCAKLIAQESKEYKKPFQDMKKEIKKMGALLFKLFSNYREHPQVVYFLVSRHEKIEEIFGSSIASKLFKSLFPAGIPEAEAFLLEKFEDNGFLHLLPSIQKQLETLSHA